MGIRQRAVGSFFVGLYAWIVSVFIGAILVDMLYAKLVPAATGAFSQVSDFLLLFGFVTVLAGLVAITISWKSKIARTLIIASLLALSLEILLPILFSQLINNAQLNFIGPWLRIIPVGLASILAFVGLDNYYLL